MTLLGHGAGVLLLEAVPVPRHGAHIRARAPTKGYIQTGARASLNGALVSIMLRINTINISADSGEEASTKRLNK